MKTGPSLIKLIVFIVVTVLATGMLAATIGNIRLGGTTPYRALFTDATGLMKGDDVRIAGVRVGEVDSVAVTESGGRSLAEVTFTVDADRPVAVSTKAQIRYRNLVGQRYVALSEGAGSGRRLTENGTIPLRQTQPALDLTVLFNGFKPLFAALNPEDVNSLRLRDHQDPAGRGRQRELPARAHGVADLDAGRPRRGDRPDDRQPQHGARHGRRARPAAVDPASPSCSGSSAAWPRTARRSAHP